MTVQALCLVALLAVVLGVPPLIARYARWEYENDETYAGVREHRARMEALRP